MEFSEQWIEQPTGVQLQAGGEVQAQEELLPPPPTATCGDQELVVKLAGIMDPPLLTGPSWSHSLQLTRQTPLELPRPTLPIMPQVTFKITLFLCLCLNNTLRNTSSLCTHNTMDHYLGCRVIKSNKTLMNKM